MNLVNINKKLFYFLLAILLLRPSLDAVYDYQFQPVRSLPSFNLNMVFGGLIFLIAGFFFVSRIKTNLKAPLFWPICILFLLFLSSIFYSYNYLDSAKEFIRLSSIFLLYFFAYNLISSKKDFYLVLKCILISYILPGLFAIYQIVFDKKMAEEIGAFSRIYGTFAHPNPFAFYTFFILSLAATLVFALQSKEADDEIEKIVPPFILYPALLVLGFLLFATYTRSALAVFLLFLFVFGFYKYRNILIVIGLALVVMYLLSDIFRERIWDILTPDPMGSIVWRFRLWQDVWSIAFWNPIKGQGLNMGMYLVEFYRGVKWGSTELHNDYLKLFVENGLLGLGAYLSLIIVLFYRLFNVFRQNRDRLKIVALGILTIALGIFAISSFDNILRNTSLLMAFWILIGAWFKISQAEP